MLRIHSMMDFSRANGPGVRAVIWVQGCTLRCPGCFNPELMSSTGGTIVTVDVLYRRILDLGDRIEGITISGGEPLQQMVGLLALLQRIRIETNRSVVLFTGYTLTEIQSMTGSDRLLRLIDVLIAGRFDQTRRTATGLRGSSNQEIVLLTDRYRMADIQGVPSTEILITEDGEIIGSGIDPLGGRSDQRRKG